MKKFILIVLLVLPMTASAATYIERAAAVIDALIDGTSTGAQQTRVADAYVQVYGADYHPTGSSNPADFTNEQKAQVFVESIKRQGQEILRAGKLIETQKANDATIQAAGDDL